MMENYYIELPETLMEVKRETGDFVRELSDIELSDVSVTRLNDFLYFKEYKNSELDLEYVKNYFISKKPHINPTGCSSFRSGNWYGRNLDWTYDNQVEFVIKTESVLGIAGNIPALNYESMQSRKNFEEYKLLPYYLMDGINSSGLFCNTNVVPTDKGYTTGTNPAIETRETICSVILPMYILTKFTTAQEAIDYLKNYVSIFVPESLMKMGYETHLMIGDTEKTYVVEFINNQVVEIEHNIMTNFYLSGVTFNQDGKVNSVVNGDLPSENGITPNGAGMERYNMIVDNIDEINSKESTFELLSKLHYTNTYLNLHWPSEFVSYHNGQGISCDTQLDDPLMIDMMRRAEKAYKIRNRKKPITWQTTHSSIYDLGQKILFVSNQETNTNYKFNLSSF